MNNYRKKSTTKNKTKTKIKIKDNEKKGNNNYNDNSATERKEVVHRGSVDSTQQTALGEIPRNQKPDKISVLNFEDFSSGPLGISLKTAYENAKETLVENKNRQRQIVSVLNKLKCCIDGLELKLNLSGGEYSDNGEGKRGEGDGEGKKGEGEEEGKRGGEGEGKGDVGEKKIGEVEREEEEEEEEKEGNNGTNNNNKNNQNKQHRGKDKDNDKDRDRKRDSRDNNNTISTITSDLVCAKRDYRLSSKELQLCKLQVMEIQSLKKIALSTLLQAYQNQK